MEHRVLMTLELSFRIVIYLSYRPKVSLEFWSLIFCLKNSWETCALYYKYITILNDSSIVISKWCHSLEHKLLTTLELSFRIVINLYYRPKVSLEFWSQNIRDLSKCPHKKSLCMLVAKALMEVDANSLQVVGDPHGVLVQQLRHNPIHSLKFMLITY